MTQPRMRLVHLAPSRGAAFALLVLSLTPPTLASANTPDSARSLLRREATDAVELTMGDGKNWDDLTMDMKVPSGDVEHTDLDNLNALLNNLKSDSPALSSAKGDDHGDHEVGVHRFISEEPKKPARFGASVMEDGLFSADFLAGLTGEERRATAATEVKQETEAEDIQPRQPIWCGGHGSPSCAACPEQKGEVWCNADCEWMYGECQFRADLVWCGGHSAQSCGECVHLLLKDAGQGWCNGECSWNGDAKTCSPMKRLANTGWATEGNPQWWKEFNHSKLSQEGILGAKPSAPAKAFDAAAPAVKATVEAPSDSMKLIQKYIFEWDKQAPETNISSNQLLAQNVTVLPPQGLKKQFSASSSLLAQRSEEMTTVATTTPAPRSLHTTATTTAVPRPA